MRHHVLLLAHARPPSVPSLIRRATHPATGSGYRLPDRLLRVCRWVWCLTSLTSGSAGGGSGSDLPLARRRSMLPAPEASDADAPFDPLRPPAALPFERCARLAPEVSAFAVAVRPPVFGL